MIPLLLIGAAVIGFVVGYWLARARRRSTPKRLRPDDAGPDGLADPQQPLELVQSRANADIERALAGLRLGVVVVDERGSEVYRNNLAKQYATGRHGDALVEAALERVVEGALLGLSLEESVEVYGPPARSVLVQASATYDGGQLSGAVCVMDDVTEARHIDRVRSDFVANVSHELRTPVGAMSVLAETIADSEDPEVVDRLAKRMQREATRLSSTIDDLMALSRLESGMVTDPETIDLVSVASMATERTSEPAQQREVLVTVENGHGGPIFIDGDQGQMVAAVANLIDNAIKYSDTGGDVVVLLGIAIPSDTDSDTDSDTESDPSSPASGADTSAEQKPFAELSVVDSGIGIPDRDLARIFERFYRVDSARSRENGGTGLGLSIVRHALLNHGGSIDVESIEGQGSRFTMRIPLSSAQQQLGAGRPVSAMENTAMENTATENTATVDPTAIKGADKWTS